MSVASFTERLLDCWIHPCSMRTSWWSPPVLRGEAVKISLASVSSGIQAMWLNYTTLLHLVVQNMPTNLLVWSTLLKKKRSIYLFGGNPP